MDRATLPPLGPAASRVILRVASRRGHPARHPHPRLDAPRRRPLLRLAAGGDARDHPDHHLGILYYGFTVYLPVLEADRGWTRGQQSGAFSLAMLLSGLCAAPAAAGSTTAAPLS